MFAYLSIKDDFSMDIDLFFNSKWDFQCYFESLEIIGWQNMRFLAIVKKDITKIKTIVQIKVVWFVFMDYQLLLVI